MASNLPFVAYKGEEAYVFISYAHKDSERVFPIIKQMHEAGYRIWYDEGIDPGSEWPEEIAKHINGASAVLLFVSPQSMDSHNVRREVTFAINLRTLMVSVYLEPTEMSAGMSLQLGLNQAVHYYIYRTDAEFFGKLLPALPEKLKCEKKTGAQVLQQSFQTGQGNQQWHQQPQLTPQVKFQIPDKLEAQAQPPTGAPVSTHIGPTADFDPSGMVLPFMQKGIVKIQLRNGGETTSPLNCFVVPQSNGNYDCICLNKSLRDKEQYFYGTRGDSYRFENMASIDVTEVNGRLQLFIYLANGERRFFEDVAPFEVGGLFGRSFRRYQMADISRISFAPNEITDDIIDLALVTTRSGISFYTPVGMLETLQFVTNMGASGFVRYSGFPLEGSILEFRKLKTLETDIKPGGTYSDGHFPVRYTLRSGTTEALEFTRHYTPSLSGINQFGCFNLSFAQVTRIDVYTGDREGAPTPTPLPDITWPQPHIQPVPFFPEGRAVITDAAGTRYECPANTVFGLDGIGKWVLYDGINMNITGEPFSELFKIQNRTGFENLESMELDYVENSYAHYAIRMRDTAGITLNGIYSKYDDTALPALVFAHGGDKGVLRIMALKRLELFHDDDAPEVAQAVVYTKTGRAIGIPRGSVTFASGGLNSYPGCCFSLPTGNSVEIRRLRRMMIHDQQNEEGMQRWIVFECDDLRGAFPLVPELWGDYRLFGASEFGLCQLNAGDEWYLLDMKK